MAPNEKSAKRAQIDENLKRVYNETLNQELPDRFKDLLAKLRQNSAEAVTTPESADKGDRS